MKILITGGGGLIGQAIARKHIAEGDEVYIYDWRLNKFNDYSNLVGNDVTFREDSSVIGDKIIRPIPEIISEFDFDVVSNQAALVGVGQSQYKIEQYSRNNVGATASLLQAILDTKKFPKKIIHAGSMGPYGEGNPFGATSETDAINPKSIYGVTKFAQEELIRVFAETYDVPSISLRYFSVYSTNQSPLNPYTGVLSIIANQCLNSDKIEIYDDGGQYRDLIHVDDIAEAHFIASRKPFKVPFIPINIGTGTFMSIDKIAILMRDILAPDKAIVFNGKYRKGDVYGLYADTNLANVILEWKPKINLDQGILEYCKFILENKEKFTTVWNTVSDEQKNVENKGLVS